MASPPRRTTNSTAALSPDLTNSGYADRIVSLIVGERARAFGLGRTDCNLWHHMPVLARKPGALRRSRPIAAQWVRARWRAARFLRDQMIIARLRLANDRAAVDFAGC